MKQKYKVVKYGVNCRSIQLQSTADERSEAESRTNRCRDALDSACQGRASAQKTSAPASLKFLIFDADRDEKIRTSAFVDSNVNLVELVVLIRVLCGLASLVQGCDGAGLVTVLLRSRNKNLRLHPTLLPALSQLRPESYDCDFTS